MPLRRRNAPRIAQLISSIGAAILIVNLAQLLFQNLFNSTEQYFPRGLIPDTPIQITEGVSVQPIRLIILAVSLVLMLVLQYLVNRTRIGRQMRAVAFNQRTARLLGINVSRIYIFTFFVAGMLGGAGGLLYGLAFGRVTPFMGQDIALVGLTALVLGGMGSIPGAVIGGFLVAIFQTFSVVIGGSSYRDALVFILFFLILLVAHRDCSVSQNKAGRDLMDFFRSIGISETVFQFMLVDAILGLSIYLPLYTGMFSLANAGFMAIGAYGGVLITQQLGLPLGVGLVGGMIVAGIIAIPIGLPVLRLRDIYLAIATIGFGEVVRIVLLNFDDIAGSIQTALTGETTRVALINGARGIKGIPKTTETWQLILFLILASYFIIRLHRSRFGRAMAAIRQDERAAETMGINTVYVKNVVFILSAMLAGAAGVFSGHLTRIITPGDYGFSQAVDISPMRCSAGRRPSSDRLSAGWCWARCRRSCASWRSIAACSTAWCCCW